jgi:16S rRNA pseudouridine516 synthase
MRLDKFIAQQLGVSRAIAGREIRASRVTVDGDIVRDSAFKLQPDHQVEYDGNPLTQQHGPRYFMLNKPEGYVCSTDDPDHPTVLYFLDEPVAHKLHAAGRLDIDTTGLVLMTDDGQWSHRITSRVTTARKPIWSRWSRRCRMTRQSNSRKAFSCIMKKI